MPAYFIREIFVQKTIKIRYAFENTCDKYHTTEIVYQRHRFLGHDSVIGLHCILKKIHINRLHDTNSC